MRSFTLSYSDCDFNIRLLFQLAIDMSELGYFIDIYGGQVVITNITVLCLVVKSVFHVIRNGFGRVITILSL